MSQLATAAHDVLQFWFGDGDDAQIMARNATRWWRSDATVDAEIAQRFSALRKRAIAGELEDWGSSPQGQLALIVLVDQFSRNLFRRDPRAFEYDPLAQRWCRDGLATGADMLLRPIERVFFYLPLEHSESIADQDRAVQLFTRLRDEVAVALREPFANFLEYAQRHRDVIARFGRFPHRNAALGRTSSAEEIAFLQQPGSSF
jgi:uncharacterized protein (DUF924 family)